MNKFLGSEEMRKFSASFYADPKNILAMNSVTQNGIASVAVRRSEVDRMNFTFSDLIDSPDATNQEKSGRCWLFSGLSLLALEAMRKLNLKTFELSETYQMFWDKLEKANYFLENVIETMDEPLNGRVSACSSQTPYQMEASGTCSSTLSRSTAFCRRRTCLRPITAPTRMR